MSHQSEILHFLMSLHSNLIILERNLKKFHPRYVKVSICWNRMQICSSPEKTNGKAQLREFQNQVVRLKISHKG